MCDKDFIKACLMQILSEDASDEIVNYIVTIENEDDYNEFMENIVDRSNPEHVTAYDALKANLLGLQSEKSISGFKAAEKVNTTSEYHKESTSTGNNTATASNKNIKQSDTKRRKPQQQTRKNNKNVPQKPLQIPSVQAETCKEPETKPTARPGTKSKKLKFVNFYSQDHKPGLLKGRHPCNCEAKKHDLINNCIKCGRIVCEQEGSGPCFFCDNMVCTNEEMELLMANTKESDKLYNFLMERSRSKEWKKAIEARDRLLLNDSLGSAKNVVYDDESDYFKVNSAGVVEEADEKSHDKAKMDFYTRAPRREMKVSLNLATRTVTAAEDGNPKNKQKLLSDIHKLLETHSKRVPRYFFDKDELNEEAEALMQEFLEQQKQMAEPPTPVGVGSEEGDRGGFSAVDTFRPANEQLREIVDAGMCLSMHQPYASLLVAGIKKHEGRTWKTNHRGRLWIAAAAREPTDDEVLECEEMYRNYYCDPSLKFPKKYPVSCLLGCVHVENCLPQNEYRELYPNGESASPFVLICRNPVILPVFYPMSGQHKIFPLKKDLHRKARAALLSATWVE